MTEAEHPNAALSRRALRRVRRRPEGDRRRVRPRHHWRVPGDTVMSGEYHGRVAVMEFLRRTGLETGGTYRSPLHTVFADDDWAVAIYRAQGRAQRDRARRRPGARDPAAATGMWQEVTAVPLDSAFERFWA